MQISPGNYFFAGLQLPNVTMRSYSITTGDLFLWLSMKVQNTTKRPLNIMNTRRNTTRKPPNSMKLGRTRRLDTTRMLPKVTRISPRTMRMKRQNTTPSNMMEAKGNRKAARSKSTEAHVEIT